MIHSDKFKSVNLRQIPKLILTKLPKEIQESIPKAVFAFYDVGDFEHHDELIKFLMSINGTDLENFFTALNHNKSVVSLQTYLKIMDIHLNVPIIYFFANFIRHSSGLTSEKVYKIISKHSCTNKLKTIANIDLLNVNTGVIADFLKLEDSEDKAWDALMSDWIARA